MENCGYRIFRDDEFRFGNYAPHIGNGRKRKRVDAGESGREQTRRTHEKKSIVRMPPPRKTKWQHGPGGIAASAGLYQPYTVWPEFRPEPVELESE